MLVSPLRAWQFVTANFEGMCIGSLPSIWAIKVSKSFSLGQLPSKWKPADITPLLKKGSKNCRNHYRHISLTSIICKPAEQMVKRRIIDFGGETKVFNPNQFAYMKDRSMVTQLLSCFNDRTKSRNEKSNGPNSLRLLQSIRYGIDGPLLKWSQSFIQWSMATRCFAR